MDFTTFVLRFSRVAIIRDDSVFLQSASPITLCAMEMAMHLTGRYPDWREGRRSAHPSTFGVHLNIYPLVRTSLGMLPAPD